VANRAEDKNYNKLVSCARGPLTRSRDTGQDLVGGFRPHEGCGRRIAEGNVCEDRGLEPARAAMRATPDLFFGQEGEPPLAEVEPGCTGGGEVKMEAPPPSKPAVNHGRLVRAIVIENQVHVQFGRHAASMVSRNSRNSLARCRRCSWPMTCPLLASNAAKNDVVPWRT